MSNKKQKKSILNAYAFWISLCVDHPDYKWVYAEIFNILNGVPPKKYSFSDKQVGVMKKQLDHHLSTVRENINSVHKKFSKT